MRSAEALDILRALTKDGLEVNFPLDSLSERSAETGLPALQNIMPAPQLVGKILPSRLVTFIYEGLRRHRESVGTRPHPGDDQAQLPCSLAIVSRTRNEPAPKVSIVVPIYNRGWLVESLIENCLEQRYCPLEIVVVDDGLTDDTSVRLATLADQIKVIRQPNGGVSAARNAGVLAATGELVQFLIPTTFSTPGISKRRCERSPPSRTPISATASLLTCPCSV